MDLLDHVVDPVDVVQRIVQIELERRRESHPEARADCPADARSLLFQKRHRLLLRTAAAPKMLKYTLAIFRSGVIRTSVTVVKP